jgi:hypothetical protein
MAGLLRALLTWGLRQVVLGLLHPQQRASSGLPEQHLLCWLERGRPQLGVHGEPTLHSAQALLVTVRT